MNASIAEPDSERIERAAQLIERLAPIEKRVLSYDRSVAEELPAVLTELHGIRPDAEDGLPGDLLSLFDLLDPEHRTARRPDALPALMAAFPAIASRLRTDAPAAKTRKTAAEFDHWTENRASENLDAVLELQADLGKGRHNRDTQRYDAEREPSQLRGYLRSVTSTPPTLLERLTRRSYWELRLAMWKLSGAVDANLPSLSVGPRWVTEIHFFRQVLGFREHIGLDLFSDDPSLVVAGDMHAMPFPDGRFGMSFLKNVVDKSYDIRRLVNELIRVAAPGGVVIVDQVCGYRSCNPLTRTDIQSARNLRRLFESRSRIRTLICDDVDISGIGDAKGTGESRVNARLALQILK